MAEQYYGWIPRWQLNVIFQSLDGSTILYFNHHVHQMAAQYYFIINRWQPNIIFPDGSKQLVHTTDGHQDQVCIQFTTGDEEGNAVA